MDLKIMLKNDILSKYEDQPIHQTKTYFCRFFLLGNCLFQDQCKFAHSLNDLRFPIQELDHMQLIHEVTNEQEVKKNQIKRQPLIKLDTATSYKCLYDYQHILIKSGLINDPYTLDELNNDRVKKEKLRVKMHIKLSKDTIEYLFDLYKVKSLSKKFIDKCFSRIGWYPNWIHIICQDFCFETISSKRIIQILKVPSLNIYEEDIRNSIFKILFDYNLILTAPINSETIIQYFYKYILKNYPLTPPINLFLKIKNKSLDDYLYDLESEEKFQTEFKEKSRILEIDISNIDKIFKSAHHTEELYTFINKIFYDMQKSSILGLIQINELLGKIVSFLKQKQKFRVNSNFFIQLKKDIKESTKMEDLIEINLLSGTYFFSLKYYYEISIKDAEMNLEFISNKNMINDEILGADCKKFIINSTNNLFNLKTQIFLIDSNESFEIARVILADCNEIAIDLEGNLKLIDGLELIQLAFKKYIFVFDIYFIRSKTMNQSDLKSVELYEKIKLFIKYLLEDDKIIKVFHSCIFDVLALNQFNGCFPKNVLDTSALQMFINSFEYQSCKMLKVQKCNFKKNIEAENVKKLDNNEFSIKAPGLNDLLKEYNASNGLNELKDLMKSKFNDKNSKYFLKRPIDEEFLIYSAKDVEDLIEIKDKILIRLQTVLEKKVGNICLNRIEKLAYTLSETYVLRGLSCKI